MKKFRLGLIGFPLGHSLSPQLHVAALRALDLEGEYRLFPLPPTPEGIQAMLTLFEHMRRAELHGLNVTIPHKKTVIPYLDELTPTARAIGAVNTILVRGEQLTGDNTDCPAFLADLTARLEQVGLGNLSNLTGRTALVLGAGGSARAVVYGLLHSGWQVQIAARRPEQAQELIQSLNPPAAVYAGGIESFTSQNLENIHLVVNTTPLGMHPQVENSPWPAALTFPAGAFVYDLVYNPPETGLLRSARLAGLPAANGLGMLVRQAALAFWFWTGQQPPWQVMYRAVAPAAYEIERLF